MTPINSIGNNQQQSVHFWMASCLAMTTLGFVCACFTMVLLRSFRASLQRRHSMTTNALRHCDDEERGRSNPELEVQHWMGWLRRTLRVSCLAMTKGVYCHDALHCCGSKGARASPWRLLIYLFPYSLIHSFSIIKHKI